jgi:long-chain acyl-CoA synthetase
MLVQHFLENSAARYPDKTALICGEQRLTYAEVNALANRLANAFIDHGMQRSDRVVVIMPNSIEVVVAIYATLKAGGTFVVVNATTKRDKLTYILNNCRASVLVTASQRFNLARLLLDKVPSLKFAVLCGGDNNVMADAEDDSKLLALTTLVAGYPPAHLPCHTIDQDLACLIYTSGSTGEPKGVMSGHNNVIFASGSIIEYLENTPDDIVINVLPLSFDYGLYQLLMTFRFGGTLVLEKSFAYPAAILKRIEAERVTGFPGVPTIFAILLQMDLRAYDLSSLRYLTNTAAALPPEHVIAIRERFSWAKLYSMYGLTECKRTLYLPPAQLDKRPGSVGIAIPGTEVWIEDENGNRLGPGVIGELVIRGSHVMRGYWEDPEATAKAYHPGPTPGERILYSGDYFKMDDEGYLYFVSRKDDIIKSRGEKVSPKEVEDVLYSIAGVMQAAVIGVPDPLLGQAIKAFVVLEGSEFAERDILRYCREHLEDIMVPQQVEIRESLPVSSNGKIIKKALY